jgi:hypothetical protein
MSDKVGPRIHLPYGIETIREWVEMGMALNLPNAETAHELGIGVSTYARVRDMILLSQRTDLNSRDYTTVQEALRNLEILHRIGKPWATVKPIADRVNLKMNVKHLEQFDSAITFLLHACESALSMNIPHIGDAQAEAAKKKLCSAEALLRKLKERITEVQYGGETGSNIVQSNVDSL